MTADEIAQRLDAKRNGTGWMARCPAHEDGKASLSITEGKEGRVLLHCHAGCNTQSVLLAMGLALEDLFLDTPAKRPTREIIATYPYHDENGEVLYEVVRFEPKDFRQRKPDGTWGTKGVRRVLYRLPAVLKAVAEGWTIYILEGEKDCDRLREAGLVATCNSGGAGKWSPTYTETLRGGNVVIVADKDTPGRQHAETVANALHGVARSVKVVELPDVHGKPVKDAADFFTAGGDKFAFEAITDAAQDWKPSGEKSPPLDDKSLDSSGDSDADGGNPPPLPPIESAAALIADETLVHPPELIHGLLHQGLKCVLGSASKSRKTWVLMDASISVSAGIAFWKWPTTQARVLFINFEIPRAFLRSRLECLARAKGVSDLSGLDTWTLRGHAAPLWRLLPDLLERVTVGQYGLIVIDPIYKTLSGRDENSAGDVGQVCNEVERVAVETGAAVTFAAHYSKGSQAGKEAIDRVSGSGVFGRDADTMLLLTAHEEEDCYTVDSILRNLPEQEPFTVQWQFPVMMERPDLDPGKLRQRGPVKQHDLLDLLSHIEGSTPEQPVSTSRWATAAGIKRETLNGYLPAMRSKGWVQTVGEGTKARRYITDEGRAALGEVSSSKPHQLTK